MVSRFVDRQLVLLLADAMVRISIYPNHQRTIDIQRRVRFIEELVRKKRRLTRQVRHLDRLIDGIRRRLPATERRAKTVDHSSLLMRLSVSRGVRSMLKYHIVDTENRIRKMISDTINYVQGDHNYARPQEAIPPPQVYHVVTTDIAAIRYTNRMRMVMRRD